MTKDVFKFSGRPEFRNPALIVGWGEDAGKLSPKVINYLNSRIRSKSFCEIEPGCFFSLDGVAIENNVARFPENKFYYSEDNNLVIFKGYEPQFERYGFLSAILDVAQQHCEVKELFTISGTVSAIAHTDERRILTVFNQEEFQEELAGYGLEDMTWEGLPAVSTYLLWLAEKRGIMGVSLWPEIPFYLAGGEDFEAIKVVLSFLDKRFKLGLDLKELNEKIVEQNSKIARLREKNSDINRYIGTLEGGLSLDEVEQLELVRVVTEALGEGIRE